MPKGKAIGFKPLIEEWNYYYLDDGNILGVKVVISKIIKTEQYDPTGLPIYVFQATNVVKLLTPQEYKETVKESRV
jgi:hypothetical protein